MVVAPTAKVNWSSNYRCGIMEKTIVILATMDTKGEHVHYIRELIRKRGHRSIVIDIGVLGIPFFKPDILREDVAAAAGVKLQEIVRSLDRERAMRVMSIGAARIVKNRYINGELDGIIGIGGNQGTAVSTYAMRAIPIGVPKLVVSTVASGNVHQFVSDRDITMMFSVTDMVGEPNFIIKPILANAAGAIVGMVEMNVRMQVPSRRKVIGVTAFGNINPAVLAVRELLAQSKYEVVVFHGSGGSGMAMEELIDQGVIKGVVDLVTHEVIGEIFEEDTYAPVRSGRLEAAGRRGIPQVIAPGGLDYFVFAEPRTIPPKYRDRKIHIHNPYNSNVRTSKEEMRIIGKVLATKVNKAKGPIAVIIPLKGFSEYGKEGGELYDPEADMLFIKTLSKHVKSNVQVVEVDANINDPIFAEKAVSILIDLMKNYQGVKER